MQDIIIYSEKRGGIINKVDKYQYVIDEYILNYYFPWICFILLLYNKDWKKPINLILIGHWLLRSTGSAIRNTLELKEYEPNTYWPHSKTNWYIAYSIPYLFWFSGEILADWYPLLRIKAIAKDSKKIRIVYFTCILYNITKLIGIYNNFIPIDLRITDKHGSKVKESDQFRIRWWTVIISLQITCFSYDFSIIFSLRKYLHDKITALQYLYNFSSKKEHFIEKFKQISEYRIILSMTFTLIFLPLIVIVIIISLNNKSSISPDSENSTLFSSIEQIRQAVLSFNYTLMYIDHILLKRYIDKKKWKIGTNKIKHNKNSNYHDSYTIYFPSLGR
eukprot:jgi/Orpsp1_1/1180707/evm.model.c7180000074381.1